MMKAFNAEIAIPAIKNLQELSRVLGESGMFESQDLNVIVNTIGNITGTDKVNVGVKTVLTLASTARKAPDPVDWFSEEVAKAINNNTPQY